MPRSSPIPARRLALAGWTTDTPEARRLLADPAYGWNLSAPAARPVLWLDANGSGLSSTAGFRAENLNRVRNGPDTSFATPKGTDALGRPTFGPATGMPADGNYDLLLPAAAFSPARPKDVLASEFFVNADFNHDRAVDFDDLLVWSQNNGTTGRSFAQGDADADGDVDNADYAFLTARYNRRLAPAPSYAGEVTVSSLPVQADGGTPLVVNFTPMEQHVGDDGPSVASSIAGYSIYRSTDGTTFAKIGEVERDPEDWRRGFGLYGYTDDSVADGTKYHYRIRPYFNVTNPDGTPGVQHLSTTNKDWRVSALRAPSDVQVTATTSTSVTLSWQDNSASEVEYRIYRIGDDGSIVDIGAVAAGIETATISDLTATASYTFRVVAKNLQITSSFSQIRVVRDLEVEAELDGKVDFENDGEDPTLSDKIAELEDALGRLLRAFQENPSEDLAKVIQATQAVLKQMQDAQAALVRGILDGISDSVDDALDQIEGVTGVTDKLTEARAALDAIPELPELPGEADLRAALAAAGDAADKIAALVGDNIAASALAKLQAALGILNPIRDMADSDLAPGNIISGLGGLIDGVASLLPEIPGVSQMLDFYTDAMVEIGSAINDINDINADRNLDRWTDPNAATDVYPGSTFGPAWADGILDDLDPGEIPDDPMQWPTHPSTGKPRIPPALQGYLD